MNIFITIDYELFLGKEVGTVKNCLINPLNALLKKLDDYNIKLNLFVDVAYLLRLQQLKDIHPSLQKDYDLVVQHLSDLSESGHDIQLHFHPQWLYSDYNDGWQLDYQHYKMSDMDSEFLKNCFSASKRLLEEIIGKEIIAFRAGGYSLESLKNFTNLFSEHKIIIDSSVLRYAYSNSKYQKYDYRNVCSKTLYSFSSSVKKENIRGNFKELPISTIKVNSLVYLFMKYRMKRQYVPKCIYGDGKSININYTKKELLSMKFNKMLHPMIIPASLDGIMSGLIPQVYQMYAEKDNFVIIGHPKLFTDASINNVIDFVNRVKDKVSFVTICSLHSKETGYAK